jgi:hypothetical protein
MSANPDFNTKAFYNEHVRPHLKDLSRLQRWTQTFFIGGGLTAAIGIAQAALVHSELLQFQFYMLFAWFMAVAFFVFGYFKQQELKSRFKSVVIAKLIQALYPSLRYRPNAHIPQEVYKASRLFPRAFDRYVGDDLIEGKLDQTDFSVSELHTEYTTTNSKGQKQSHTIFRGLFFHADFHKHFSGSTYVFPDRAEALLGKWLGQGIQAGFSQHGKIVKLENPVFERLFVTYSEDQQEARYLLSPNMMERLMALRKKMGVELSFGFLQGRVFVAIATGREHFEPRIWGGTISMNDIAEHRSLIHSVIAIIDELKLNERIWTKA